MKTFRESRILLAISFGLALSTSAFSQIVIPKFTADKDSLFPKEVVQEIHLPVSLFVETNRSFDLAIYKSVQSVAKSPVVISFKLVSFVFYYPTTNDWIGSVSEMSLPDELLCRGENVSRRASVSTNEIPVNSVRVVDRHKKELTAELDLLLGVAPMDKPQDVQYVRRSFRFVYRDGWKQGK